MRNRTFLIAAAIVFALARVASVVGRPVVEFKDTVGYRDVSFIGDAYRPWGYSVVLAALDAPWLIAAFQVAAGVAGFTLLAVALAGEMWSAWAARAVASIVFLVGVHPRVTSWDLALLTESLSISTTCVLIAAGIMARRDARWWWLFAATFGWWLFLRDGHPYMAVPVVAVIAWLHWGTQRRLVLALTGLLAWSLVAGQVNQQIEQDNAAANIVWHAPENDDLDWFVDRGMPVGDAFDIDNPRTRYDAANDDDGGLGEWVDEQGASIWAKYLISHPDTLLSPLTDWDTIEPARSFTHPRTIAVSAVWPDSTGLVVVLLAGLLGALITLRGGWDRRLFVPTLLVLSTIPHQLIAVHASPIEHQRHAFLMVFVLVVAAWWLACIGLDRVLLERRSLPADLDVPVSGVGAVGEQDVGSTGGRVDHAGAAAAAEASGAGRSA